MCLLRVSSDQQFQEGQGIDNQKSRCDYYADRNDISIIQYFYEHYSGRKTDRIVLEDMLSFAKTHKGDISLLIVGNIDRFTRAGADIYLQLKKLFAAQGIEVVDASGVIQKPVNTLEHLGVSYEWSERSPSRLTEVLLAENANSGVTDILTRCIGGQIRTARKGYQFRPADFGYRNKRVVMSDGYKATIMTLDPQEAKWVKTIFALRAEGILDDEQICISLNAMGFRTRKHYRYDPQSRIIIGKGGGKPLCPKAMHRIISRPVYCGFRCSKWTDNKPVKLPYDQSLVTIKVFNKANRGKVIIEKIGEEYEIQLNKLEYRNQKNTSEFAFRHVVVCPRCKEPFVASRSRSKGGSYFGYYHCNRNHKYLGINEQEFEMTVANYISKITFKRKYYNLLKEVVRDIWIRNRKRDIDLKDSIQAHISKLKIEQDSRIKTISLSSSVMVQKRLESDYEQTEEEIVKAQKELEQPSLLESEINEYFHRLKSIMEHPAEFLLAPTSKEKLRKTWGFVFQSPPTYSELKNGTPPLSLVFRLLRGSQMPKSQMVEQLKLHWNTFENDVRSFLATEGDPVSISHLRRQQ